MMVPVEGEAGTSSETAAARIATTDLFRGRREIVIVHRGIEYRLHITESEKLILTK